MARPIEPATARSPASMLRNFDRFDDAQQAHAALLQAGLPASAVQLRIVDDEAGPVEGNFLIGNGRGAGANTVPGEDAGVPLDYAPNFANTVHRGVHLLVVAPADEAQRTLATTVLGRFGAIDLDAVHAASDHAGKPR